MGDNYTFPNLPVEVTSDIFSLLNPKDIPNLCLVNKDNYQTYCRDLITKWYGEGGYNVIKSLTYDQFVKLTNILWPSYQFSIKQNKDISLQMLDRALSLQSASIASSLPGEYIDNSNMRLDRLAVSTSEKIQERRSYVRNVQKLLDRYTLYIDDMENRKKLVKSDNPIGILEDDKYGRMQYIETGGSIANWTMYDIFMALRLFPYSSYPSLVFNRLKDKLFNIRDEGDDVQYGSDRIFLKNVYTVSTDKCKEYILNNIYVQLPVTKMVVFYIYTQRKDYDPMFAGYLFSVHMRLVTEPERWNNIGYAINMDDIQLFKVVNYALISRNIQFAYSPFSQIQFAITGIENIPENNKLGDSMIRSLLVSYSDVRTYYNAIFLRNIGYDSLSIHLYNVKYYDGIKSDGKDDMYDDYSITKLFCMAITNKKDFIEFLTYALDKVIL